MHYLINAWLEKGGMLSNYDSWCGLEFYQSGSDCGKLMLVEMGKNLESICMEDQ